MPYPRSRSRRLAATLSSLLHRRAVISPLDFQMYSRPVRRYPQEVLDRGRVCQIPGCFLHVFMKYDYRGWRCGEVS